MLVNILFRTYTPIHIWFNRLLTSFLGRKLQILFPKQTIFESILPSFHLKTINFRSRRKEYMHLWQHLVTLLSIQCCRRATAIWQHKHYSKPFLPYYAVSINCCRQSIISILACYRAFTISQKFWMCSCQLANFPELCILCKKIKCLIAANTEAKYKNSHQTTWPWWCLDIRSLLFYNL